MTSFTCPLQGAPCKYCTEDWVMCHLNKDGCCPVGRETHCSRGWHVEKRNLIAAIEDAAAEHQNVTRVEATAACSKSITCYSIKRQPQQKPSCTLLQQGLVCPHGCTRTWIRCHHYSAKQCTLPGRIKCSDGWHLTKEDYAAVMPTTTVIVLSDDEDAAPEDLRSATVAADQGTSTKRRRKRREDGVATLRDDATNPGLDATMRRHLEESGYNKSLDYKQLENYFNNALKAEPPGATKEKLAESFLYLRRYLANQPAVL